MNTPQSIMLDLSTPERIGFPPPLLGPEPVRLPVAKPAEGLLALALPGGVLSEAHPFFDGQPSAIGGLQAQLRKDKPELKRLGLEVALAINFLEPECSGLFMIGTSRAGVERWRNALGSHQMKFTYEFVARQGPEVAETMTCDLPLARHRREARMLVSHRTGKKSETCFTRLAVAGEFSLWQATTHLPRVHQIRVHAMEQGLQIPGESRYGEVPALVPEQLTGRRERCRLGAELPADCLPIHLARVESVNGAFTSVEAAPEGRMAPIWRAFERK